MTCGHPLLECACGLNILRTEKRKRRSCAISSHRRNAPHPKRRSDAEDASRRLVCCARNSRSLRTGQGKQVGGEHCGQRAACGVIAALSGRRAALLRKGARALNECRHRVVTSSGNFTTGVRGLPNAEREIERAVVTHRLHSLPFRHRARARAKSSCSKAFAIRSISAGLAPTATATSRQCETATPTSRMTPRSSIISSSCR